MVPATSMSREVGSEGKAEADSAVTPEPEPASDDEPGSDAELESDAEPASEPVLPAVEGERQSPRLSAKKAWALAALSAVLCPIGFAGFDVWPLAFVAWVPLILALRGQTPKRAALMGWFAGSAMTLIGFHWLINMLQVFSGFSLPLCVLFAALLCMQKGGRIALCAWLYARSVGRGWHPGLMFMGAFVVSELVYPVLFPWYYAASLHSVPVMIQTADIGGVFLVSAVVLASNVGLAEMIGARIFGEPMDRRTAALGLATPLLALAYGAIRMRSIDAQVAVSEPLKVGIVQGNSPIKRRRNALRTHIMLTKELADEVDLVVWSEAAASRSFDQKRYERLVKQRISGTLGVPTIIGVVIYERLSREERAKGRWSRYFNTALMTDAQGEITGRYDKQFLLMFGEYLPLGEEFPQLYKLSGNSGKFSPGRSDEPLPFGDHRISTMICYEDIIPGLVNDLVDAGNPDLLVNMTNDAWFGESIEPWQHLALAKFRSVEHRLFMVRATNTGVSAIIDPTGRTPVIGGVFTEEKLVGSVAFLDSDTIYDRLGNIPWWLAAGMMGLCAFARKRAPGERAF
jgi:apolipoprotein N-acyltransferase